MHHPAVTFMLPILQKKTAIRKVTEAIDLERIEVPLGCDRCGQGIRDKYRFVHMSGYDEEHIYDVKWLCEQCQESLSL